MGCETWAISTSASKEAEARRFGAAALLVSSDSVAMAAQKGSFDFILCTAAGAFEVGAYLALLKPRRTFCLVGLPAVATPLKVREQGGGGRRRGISKSERASGQGRSLSGVSHVIGCRRSLSPLTSSAARRASSGP